MKPALLSILFLQSLLAVSFAASAAEPPWVACGNEAPEKQLECYQSATRQYLAVSPKPPDTAPLAQTTSGLDDHYEWKLDRLWPLPQEFPETKRLANTFLQYQQNYLMVDNIRNPSNAPHSPNPLNTVSTASAYKAEEMKFQISLKGQMPFSWPWGDTLWFAYTQQSHWQAFDGNNSRPFRESNYAPELFFLSHRINDSAPIFGLLTPRIVNLSYLHQSNGESLPRSRSWNRLTAQLGGEYRFRKEDDDAEDRHLTVVLRPWWRIPENSKDDDNHDITKYLGHGDIEFDYWRGREQVAALLRSRALQLDWSFPLSGEVNALSLHLQYFTGYGESLIDYNHKLHSLGMGISLPY